ncbi:hypothetical protein GLOTRDRAFT_126219 [Gloeophyllum trabeum ATCC 11539]|uniref:Uncharacterized protein n=1 Tax=Gloeophyllum trabeum (strain ATCC 11539 / FP-39264 / Madison 617) TaxID=670483 RepID=S7QE88_GLOTA|nr:uncharacterized protein GLOTRDRAFT_126219 [Gloeophyllum trabeum ATCC 11539]EPQ57727.1 hypothetical protein GLOTRDRAFT_126219 [Gloeophyllum trabeum ATCC 11539]
MASPPASPMTAAYYHHRPSQVLLDPEAGISQVVLTKPDLGFQNLGPASSSNVALRSPHHERLPAGNTRVRLRPGKRMYMRSESVHRSSPSRRARRSRRKNGSGIRYDTIRIPAPDESASPPSPARSVSAIRANDDCTSRPPAPE